MKQFLINERLVVEILNYMSYRPHREVEDFIHLLKVLPEHKELPKTEPIELELPNVS